MLETLEPYAAQPGRKRPAEDAGQLDDDQAEVLEGSTAEAAPLAGVELRKGGGEVGEGQAPTAPQDQISDLAQPSAQPGPEPRGQTSDDRDQDGQEAADGLLRSRRTSSAIGTTESTMTSATSTWTYRSMLGTDRPSR